MNDLLLHFDVPGWKPVLTALLLPPVPLLLIMLLGAAWVRRRPAWGGLLVLAGAAGLWLASTTAASEWLQRQLLSPLHALSLQDLQGLQAGRRGAAGATAIVVLGAGRESYAPEYGKANLPPRGVERLRYGVWLARETGLPLAYSGGTGHAQVAGPAEAEVAAQIAARDFAWPLKWVESESRDTRENAERSVRLLRAAGVTRIVLVTHGWHMRRALKAFDQAVARSGGGVTVMAAPMGLAPDESAGGLRWLPSSGGISDTRDALREYLALWVGA